MRFFYVNLIDADGVTFTPTSEQTDLTAENLAHAHKGRVWRTGTSTAAENVVIDLGSAQAATSVIVFNHNLTNSDSGITLEANSSDSWGAPAFSQSLTWTAGPIVATFSSQSYRYWRLKFTKSASGETRDIGRLFIGTYTDISEDFDAGSFTQGREDPSVKFRSIGGQTYADIRDQWRTIKGKASHVSQASSDSLETVAIAVGEHTPFFLRVNTSDSVSLPTGEYFYVKFKNVTGREVHSHDGSEYKWNITVELEEQL